MEFMETVKKRYSCRKYDSRPVEREKLMICAEAGRLAPSACNSQRWVFVIVDDPAVKAKIAVALRDEEVRVNTFADQVPAFVVVASCPARDPNEKQKVLLSHHDCTRIDIGIAAENICLAAADQGLGSVMMGWCRRELVREAIGLPEHMETELVIGIGYPLREPASRTERLDPGEIIRLNHFDVKI